MGTAMCVSGGAVATSAVGADSVSDTAPSQWEMSTTNPFNGQYYPTYTGNGYFAARVPAQGQGFSSANVPTSFQIQGFYTSQSDTNQWRVGGPAWTGLNVADSSGSFNDAFKSSCAFGAYCQLEDGLLSGGLSSGNDHGGYQGSGFVQGFGSGSAKATLTLSGVSEAGIYDLVVRYAAGDPGDGSSNARTVLVSAGDAQHRLTLEPIEDGSWDTWKIATIAVSVPATAISDGKVQLSIAGVGNGSDPQQDSRVNIDAAALVKAGAAPEATPSGSTPEEHRLSDYKQTLNMKTGAITTHARWTSVSGNVADVAYTVLPSRANDQLGLVNVTVTPIVWKHADEPLVVTDSLDTQAASNASFDRSSDAQAHRIALTTTLDGTGQRATYVSKLQGSGTLQQSGLDGDGAIEQTLSANVETGKSYSFTKFVGLATNQDTSENTVAQTTAAATAVAEQAASQGLDAAITASDAAWAALWQGDIEITGDDQLQSQVRASRFYLLASVGERAWSPSPAGLSSDSYAGHVFWDTETWMWPSIVAQDPSIAKAILQYRADRLSSTDGAAFNALNNYEWDAATKSYVKKSYGDGSALRFPWEGGLNGKEQTSSYFFGGHEIHITADVALAFWQYYEATGDVAWLKSTGYKVIAGAANFWVARSYKGTDGKYHIDDVTPPDEWSSNGETGRNDSAYTNVAASKTLAIATQAASIVGKNANAAWQERSGHFDIPQDTQRNITKEYANYDGTGIKQADAVMLSYPWQNEQSAERTANDLDYYSTKVNEDASPSMTDAIHSIVAAELGRSDEAMWYTQRSSTGFMRGPFNQFTEERGGGSAFTFLTGAGGFLQEFYYGYTGLRWGTNGITLNPILPGSLKTITIKGMHYQGSTFDIAITPQRTTVSVTAGNALNVTNRGTAAVGKPLTFATRTPSAHDGYGTLIGSISTPAGGDNGSGSYVYPTDSVFTKNSFDLNTFKVYKDGKNIRFVSQVDGQILNPWALEGMSLQLMHIYIRTDAHASTKPTKAVAGTNINTDGAWQYVAIANPRTQTGAIGSTGLFAADGTRIANASLSVREQKDIVLTIPASAFKNVDLSKAAFQIDMMSASESTEGVNNIRPVVSCDTAADAVKEWRFCGGLGSVTNTSPYDSDTTDPNVIKAILPKSVKASEVLKPKAGGAVLPFVTLEAAHQVQPTPTPDSSPSSGTAGNAASSGAGTGAANTTAKPSGNSQTRSKPSALAKTGLNLGSISAAVIAMLAAGISVFAISRMRKSQR